MVESEHTLVGWHVSNGLTILSCFLAVRLGVNQLGVGVAPRQATLFGRKFQRFFAVEFGLANEFFDTVGEALRGVCPRAHVTGFFGADQESDFAARRALV